MSHERRLKLALAAWAALGVFCIVAGASWLVAAILGALEADTSWPLELVIGLAFLFTARAAVRRAWVAAWAIRTEPWRRRLAEAARRLDERRLDEL